MSAIQASVGRSIARLLTSDALLQARRTVYGVPRRLLGKAAQVHYFHQADDPYSQMLLRLLPALQARYNMELLVHQVPQPDAAAAPELAMLQAWSARDANRLADRLGVQSPSSGAIGVDPLPQPSKELLEQGARLRNKLGHYLGGTLYFEGEWYWGVDRLHYLEERLVAGGLSNGTASHVPLFPVPALQYRTVNPPADTAPVIHFYCSLRSPYTYLAAAQVRALAAQYGATVHLRFVLPMVMRGLPVPLAKRLYILRDAKREAKRLGIDFGCVVDPVGKPVEQGLALLHGAVEQGCGPQLLESFLQGVFADGIDAGSAQGLQRIAERAGMQADDIQQALRNDAWREQAESNRADMFARGVWGVPAFRVDERPALWGQDRLWMLEEDLLSVLSER